MTTRKAMSEAELLSEVELRESQCGNIMNSEVAREQALAMDMYLSQPLGTEEEGRSSVISSDVWDVVEGLTPLVLKPFVSSDDIVRFNPEGPEDEEAADQESDYINFVVTQKNDVFNELVAWVKTGLLQKNGVVKYWWEKSKRTSIERYEGLGDDVYTALIQDDSVHVVSHTEIPGQPQIDPQTGQPAVDPQTGQPLPPEPTHDVVIRVSEEVGEPKYCVIPPEEFRISRDATNSNPKTARFVQHVTRKTISALREMGYDVPDDINDSASSGEDPYMSEQYRARRQEDQGQFINVETNDPANREVLYRESLMYVDFDGDGMSELRKVCVVGSTVLSNEETEEINFCGWTPYPQPFKFDGRCPADETTEIQLIKSTVLRQTMDNIYTVNNNTRYVSSKVNLDDLLDNQIAGIVRVDGDIVGNHVMPAPITPIGAITMPMIEYFDSAKENRTGFTRYNQGTDSNSLNKTATGIRIIAEAGNERVSLVSRCFAEQGLKPLMLGIHGLCRRHSTKSETMKLRGKYVTVNPREWRTRYDMSVSVGLGSSDKQIQMQGAQLLLQTQAQLKQMGSPIVTPKNEYEAGSMLAKSLGEKNPDKYFTAPPDEPPAPPDPTQDPQYKLEASKVALDAHKVDEDSKFRMADLRLKAHALDLQHKDQRLKAGLGHADVVLREQAQNHTTAMDKVRMLHDIHRGDEASQQAQMPDETETEGEDPAEETVELQQKTLAAIEQMQQALVAMQQALAQSQKPLRVRKAPDGSFVGVREEPTAPAAEAI